MTNNTEQHACMLPRSAVAIGLSTLIVFMAAGAVIKTLLVEDLMLDMGPGILIASLLSGAVSGLSLFGGIVLTGSGLAIIFGAFFMTSSGPESQAIKFAGVLAAIFLHFGFKALKLPFNTVNTMAEHMESMAQGLSSLPLQFASVLILAVVLQIVIALRAAYERKAK